MPEISTNWFPKSVILNPGGQLGSLVWGGNIQEVFAWRGSQDFSPTCDGQSSDENNFTYLKDASIFIHHKLISQNINLD